MKASSKREPLSRERILCAALEIVDREGLAAISMRRIGTALGVEAMSLYNHVPNKAAILDGIFEVVLSELGPLRTRSASWQAVVGERARALRLVLRAHPNALPLFATRPAVTPASLAHVEELLEILQRAGFSADHALSALQVLVAFVVGHTLATHGPKPARAAAEPAYDRLPEQQFPRVVALARVLSQHDLEAEFELGLGAMLCGLERQRKRPAGARSRENPERAKKQR